MAMENALPCVIMLIATATCAYLPVRAVLDRRLSLKDDILLLFFWYQSWIYLHVVPTVNGLFPESDFAFPVSCRDYRVIQFTPDEIAWYAAFQVMILLLFYLPLMGFYGWCKRRMFTRRLPIDQVQSHVDPILLTGLATAYSLFGVMFYEVAVRTGLMSTYANSIDVLACLSTYDRWVWRMYVMASPFLLTIIILGYCERSRRFSIVPFLIASVPGVVLNVFWILSSSRGTVALLIMGIGGMLTLRGHVRRYTGFGISGMVVSVLLFGYGLNVIPKFRAIVLADRVTVEDYLAVLNPFHAVDDVVAASGGGSYGFRLDGLELMVLATPKMLEIGPLLDSEYALAILTPIMPLIPSLEDKLKFEEQSLDLKQTYMARYTDIGTLDYPAGALTDIFMALGPLGFFVAAATYGWLFAWLRSLIVDCTSGRSLVLGVFVYYNVAMYEYSFVSLPLGWVRCLPVLLVALVLNPFHVGKCPAPSLHRGALGLDHATMRWRP